MRPIGAHNIKQSQEAWTAPDHAGWRVSNYGRLHHPNHGVFDSRRDVQAHFASHGTLNAPPSESFEQVVPNPPSPVSPVPSLTSAATFDSPRSEPPTPVAAGASDRISNQQAHQQELHLLFDREIINLIHERNMPRAQAEQVRETYARQRQAANSLLDRLGRTDNNRIIAIRAVVLHSHGHSAERLAQTLMEQYPSSSPLTAEHFTDSYWNDVPVTPHDRDLEQAALRLYLRSETNSDSSDSDTETEH